MPCSRVTNSERMPKEHYFASYSGTAISRYDFIQTPSLQFLLLFLPSSAHRPEAYLSNPLRSLDSLLHPEKLPPAPVIVSQPYDFNIPDLTGTDCPNSSSGCQWRSKKGPPRRCKKGPLGGCGLVPVVHGRAPRATRRALNRLTRRRAREGPVGPRGQAWAGWSVQLAVGV